MAPTPLLLTRNEAARLSGASATTVNKAIEQRVVATRSHGNTSLIDARDVAALKLFAGLRFALPVTSKRQLAAWLRTAPAGAEEPLGPGIVVRKTEDLELAAQAAKRYAELKARLLEIDPARQGGEPVIRGTRVPVRALARQIETGETPEVLARDYDHLDPDAFEFAVAWARANPRRGRPAKGTPAAGPDREPAGRKELIERRRRAADADAS